MDKSDFQDEDQFELLLSIAEEFESRYNDFISDTNGTDLLKLILKGHLYIEQELNFLLRKHLKKPEHLDKRMNFISKVNLIFALGLLDDSEKKAIVSINELRNKYAHQIDFELSKQYFESNILSSFSPETKKFYLSFLRSARDDSDLIQQLGIALFTVWFLIVEKNLIPEHVRYIAEKIKMRHLK